MSIDLKSPLGMLREQLRNGGKRGFRLWANRCLVEVEVDPINVGWLLGFECRDEGIGHLRTRLRDLDDLHFLSFDRETQDERVIRIIKYPHVVTAEADGRGSLQTLWLTAMEVDGGNRDWFIIKNDRDAALADILNLRRIRHPHAERRRIEGHLCGPIRAYRSEHVTRHLECGRARVVALHWSFILGKKLRRRSAAEVRKELLRVVEVLIASLSRGIDRKIFGLGVKRKGHAARVG